MTPKIREALSMGRIVAILAVIALLFGAGATLAHDTNEANELFVEAVHLVKSAANAEGYEEKAAVLKEALAKLNKIVDDYPSSGLAVKLISGQDIGGISLDRIGKAIEETRRQAERERKHAERERIVKAEIEKIRKAAEQGDAEAQSKLGFRYERGMGVPRSLAEAVKWYHKAAEQGHQYAKYWLERLEAK